MKFLSFHKSSCKVNNNFLILYIKQNLNIYKLEFAN